MKVKFFAERAIESLRESHAIVQQYPSLEWIEDYQAFRANSVRAEKNCVIFARKRGAWLKPFHCYYHNSQYRYFSLDVAEGCAFDCVYCYLQSYLNHGALVLFVDRDAIRAELQSLPAGRYWLSTGLLSDSLLSEQHFAQLSFLSFAVPSGSVLEVRTKSDRIDLLKDDAISRESVVVSWSLNPDVIARTFEFGTAPVWKRIEAAQAAIALGYRVGLHFDPVFHFDGWQHAYHELFKQVATLDSSRIAFVSVGLFRYMPDLGSVIRKRFPSHSILSEEFFPEDDRKYHYFRPIRKEMYRAFGEWLAPWREMTPVFWSMEPDARLLPR